MLSQKQKLTITFVAMAIFGLVAIASLLSILGTSNATKNIALAEYSDPCLAINTGIQVGSRCSTNQGYSGICQRTFIGELRCSLQNSAPNTGSNGCNDVSAFEGMGCTTGDRTGLCQKGVSGNLECQTEGGNACDEKGTAGFAGRACNIGGQKGFCNYTYVNQPPFCDTSTYIKRNANCENLDLTLSYPENLYARCMVVNGERLEVSNTGFCGLANDYSDHYVYTCYQNKEYIDALPCKIKNIAIKNPGSRCNFVKTGYGDTYGVCRDDYSCELVKEVKYINGDYKVVDNSANNGGDNSGSNPIPASTGVRECAVSEYTTNPVGCRCTQLNFTKGVIETGVIISNNGVQDCKVSPSDVTAAPGDNKCSVANYISGNSVGCTCVTLNSSLQVSVGVIEKQSGINVCKTDTTKADITTGPRLCTALDVINAIKDGKDTFYGCKCTTLGTGGFADGTVTKGAGNIPYCKPDADGIDTSKPRTCDLADIAKNPGKAVGCACSTVTGSKKADGIVKLSGGKLVCTKQ